MTTQIKGLNHCEYIRKRTFDMFVEYNMNIPWKECMWRAMRLHREGLVNQMKSKIIVAPRLKLRLKPSVVPQQRQQQHSRISETYIRQQRMGGEEHNIGFFGNSWRDNA